MIRSTLVYRRFWYIRRRNAKKIHIYSRIAFVIIILMLLFSYVQKNIIGYMEKYFVPELKNKVEALAVELISTQFARELEYDNITGIIRSEDGSIQSIKTKNAVLNPISLHIASAIEKELDMFGGGKLNISFGNLLGSRVLADIGPCIFVGIRQHGHTEANFRTEFDRDGKETVVHRIYLQITTTVGMDMPFSWKKHRFTVEIPVAGAIITDTGLVRQIIFD
ncbi:hypothetical protein CDQ84_06525 [Clostridium thermosuccinogenes]|uniref:Sporulation protein YunB n=1 Tax=Clostridium thermosuccinogenes TaxID=84032 RepID=A0A2K2FNH5_9CLOT|nr:sporulation protein YunB [Pseudoclostridium thermosuccinogenes]AUS97463.1 hypothetical protein CDO33_14060 [Pseudoclostridium thermosuccinogenes]PNT98186.1 hypothetical protein CDQ85_06030 [Pseudoclostridium thermosuccinogenes]PNU00335.1 hypothetical protein CDQ84_06525 [Pseudoclostridium thermosuccinogenes]